MIEAMPRPRPLHLHREKTRHRNFAWYVRKPGEPRIRIRAEYGTPEFEEAYRAALEGRTPAPITPAARKGSLEWLWKRYCDSGEWKSFKHTTQRQRENIMAHVLAKSGKRPFEHIEAVDIVAGRDARGRQWRHRDGAGGHLWLARRRHGRALHQGCGPETGRSAGYDDDAEG